MESNISNVTTDALMSSHSFVNDLVIAIAIFLLGLIIGRILGKLVGRFVKNIGVDDFVKKKTKIKFSLEKFISGLISFIVYVVFFVIALNYIGITSLLLNVISFLIVLIIGITVILSVRDGVPNIIAFRKMSRNKSVKVGDTVEFEKASGVVKEITIFDTQIETKSGDIIHVPNNMFIKNVYTRKKRSNTVVRK